MIFFLKFVLPAAVAFVVCVTFGMNLAKTVTPEVGSLIFPLIETVFVSTVLGCLARFMYDDDFDNPRRAGVFVAFVLSLLIAAPLLWEYATHPDHVYHIGCGSATTSAISGIDTSAAKGSDGRRC